MGSLAEFVKKEAAHLKGEIERQEASLKEWKAAIDDLYATLTRWIEEADGGLRLLRTDAFAYVTCREPGLGTYEVKRLTISVGQLGSREAEIVPRARFVASQVKVNGKLRRADGIMEIREQTTPMYYLFRVKDDGRDAWFIRSVVEWNADEDYGNAFSLDRDRFEAAVLSILK
jgi:hypothetical protein